MLLLSVCLVGCCLAHHDRHIEDDYSYYDNTQDYDYGQQGDDYHAGDHHGGHGGGNHHHQHSKQKENGYLADTDGTVDKHGGHNAHDYRENELKRNSFRRNPGDYFQENHGFTKNVFENGGHFHHHGKRQVLHGPNKHTLHLES